MEQEQIQSIIKKQLGFFNHNGLEITDETNVGEVFSGYNDSAITKRNPSLFKGNVMWTLNNAGHKHSSGKKGNSLPKNWMEMSVSGLASKLFLFIAVMLLSFTAPAQLQLHVGTAKTDLRSNAISFGFKYLQSLDSTFGNEDLMVTGKKSYFLITPNAEFQTGNQDVFNSIIVRATGNYVKFRTTTVDGIETPDADKTLHVFPISVGAETNNQFSFINGLVEAGYEPFYHSATSNSPEWLKRTKFGLYMQAGYKWKTSQDTIAVGGAADESLEKLNSGLLRTKGMFLIDTKTLLTMQQIKIGLVGNANVWYDFVNNGFYYKLDGIVRLNLAGGTFLDFIYSKGSGAPNFNEGDQYGAGLTIQF